MAGRFDRGIHATEADEADRLEQEGPPPSRDPREHDHDPGTPEADALDQELPVSDDPFEVAEPIVPDVERVEPVDPDEEYPS
ncbi:MAG TPA: hypothetical protein VGL60_04575 [Acidimicrobiales bacterium]|jgi:hypothetical protein